MSVLRIAAAVFSVIIASGGAASAQGLDGPANLPPASFDGMGFNDANGCAFMRAGLSGATVWVARVDQSRQPICGLAPTFGATAAPTAPARAPAPVIVAAALAPLAPTTVAPARPAVRDAGAPINTVATLTTAPSVTARIPAAAPAPAMTPAPAPVVQPVRLTLAQACAGRTGIQPGLVSSRTGQPIDCGGAPVMVHAAAPVVTTPVVPRMTLAQICAQTAATGVRFVNQATGQPVACPNTPAPNPVAPVVLASATIAPQAAEPPRMTLAAACSMGQQTGARYINAETGRPIDCGSVATSGQAVWTLPFQSPPVPASNPTGVVAGYTGAPAGYEPVWTDGRLNTNRGIPATATDRMSTNSGPIAGPVAGIPQTLAAPAGHRYVQVGTYANPANADRTMATLRNLGLPVGTRTITRNGTPLQVIAAGPFASPGDVDAALRAVRAAGYGDAFPQG